MEQIGYALDDIRKQTDEVIEIATDYTKENKKGINYLIKY